MESKDLASTKTRKTDIFESVWLHGVHPIAESSSAAKRTGESNFSNFVMEYHGEILK